MWECVVYAIYGQFDSLAFKNWHPTTAQRPYWGGPIAFYNACQSSSIHSVHPRSSSPIRRSLPHGQRSETGTNVPTRVERDPKSTYRLDGAMVLFSAGVPAQRSLSVQKANRTDLSHLVDFRPLAVASIVDAGCNGPSMKEEWSRSFWGFVGMYWWGTCEVRR